MARPGTAFHRRQARPRRTSVSPLSPNGIVGKTAPDTMPPGERPTCCSTTLTRSVLDGGTVLVLTRHTAGCPVWTAR
ncbi:hypothetical protein [Kitasatospora sp. NPDC088134]|uniref:hypothetical protein n=1 Tax=Kitasatospora sp. NPDC088134 TaxID=3364071 RepID=UPI0037F37FA1